MIETNETPEDVDRLLVEARAKLQAFEDSVDRKRLLKRLKTQSPTHPILLFRALFLFLAWLCGSAALVVLLIPVFSTDLARVLARIEAAVPTPQGVPGMPALLGLVAGCMLIAWLASTLAAYAMGRDAQMLPWEQKQHQKLVNEVTRLTTQKAVMERIRGTPVGPRARMFTPVPQTLRPTGPSHSDTPARPSVLGARATPIPAEGRDRVLAPAGESRLLSQARAVGGASRPAPQAPSSGNGVDTASLRPSRMSAPVGFPGTPDPGDRGRAPQQHIFGTPPAAGRSLSYAAAEEVAPPAGAGLLRRHRPVSLEPTSARDLNPAQRSSYVSPSAEPPPTRQHVPRASRAFPRWAPIEDPWLEDAISKAEMMAVGLPEQAHLQFSQETHLPFTLILARATPAISMRAVLSYVEFLASIATPPRARIEMANVPQLDPEFHRNVAAALEPYFGDRVDVEPEIGRIEIIFKEPDASWQDYPVLPIL